MDGLGGKGLNYTVLSIKQLHQNPISPLIIIIKVKNYTNCLEYRYIDFENQALRNNNYVIINECNKSLYIK